VLREDERDLVIGVPTAFLRDWLTRMLHHHVREALTLLGLPHIQITFSTDPERCAVTPATSSDRQLSDVREIASAVEPSIGWTDSTDRVVAIAI
jgi:chromosomal replication initiation ATPase DnaA